jgi:hypothetical protein
MTDQERNLLLDVNSGQIRVDEFHKKFPVDIRKSKDYVVREIEAVIGSNDIEELDLTISLVRLSGTDKLFIDVLNRLLINPNHRSHQFVTKTLQDLKSPTSVPFIKHALESNFDYLTYTGSDSDAIAKWFSWALYEIGTRDAIDVMKLYAKSADEGIRKEMNYRLKRL